MRAPAPLAWMPRFLPVLAAGGAVGAAWVWDAFRRAERTAVLHRTLVDLLLNAMSAGDPSTERHSRRVADLTDVLGTAYGISGRRHARLRVAALLHDLGKIDDSFFSILHSWKPLTEEQRRRIEQHPNESAHILEPLERIHPGITAIVEAHHECWNGKGYPKGLREEAIPLEARLISVADVFDALTQPRQYHDPRSVEEALCELRKGAGHRFDPEVVDRLDRSPEAVRRWRAIAEAGRADERQESAREGEEEKEIAEEAAAAAAAAD